VSDRIIVLNDPVNFVDPLGLKVFVGQHSVGNSPFNHTAIILQPNNPNDFEKNTLFDNNSTATLGGQPFGEGYKGGHFGALQGVPNYSGDDPCGLNDKTEVKTPDGMSDTDFINALLAAANKYKDNLPYSPNPSEYSGYNSNGYVSGIISAAGGIAPNLPGSQPGYNKPIPLP
jgi:hypothetical protein